MIIGFANIYPFRPHIKHMVYLINHALKCGHEIYYLECDGVFNNCFLKIDKNPIIKNFSCIKCKFGGLNTFLEKSPDNFSTYLNDNDIKLKDFSYSSISTIFHKYGLSDIKNLKDPLIKKKTEKTRKTINKAYKGAKNWIKHRKFDLVFGFNGRIDITNGILNASLDLKIPYVSVERSWTGNGIQLNYNGTPTSLKGFHDTIKFFRDKPLNRDQISLAYSFVFKRFNKISLGEFRQYNLKQKKGLFKEKIKWLYLPSSIYERIEHPDFKNNWIDPIKPINFLIKKGFIKPSEIIIRGHPQWQKYSMSSEIDFTEISKKLGIRYIPSNSKISTQELIINSENLIVFGSSSAFEAGILGKRILNLSHTFYLNGGFTYNFLKEGDFDIDKFLKMDPRKIIIQTLRCIYSINNRYMQFLDSLKAKNSYDYDFNEFEDLKYFDKIIKNKSIPFNDDKFEKHNEAEKNFLNKFFINRYKNIYQNDYLHFDNFKKNKLKKIHISRKREMFFMDIIDTLTKK